MDPMTVCLGEIPELTYTYYDEDNHGESVLHEELMKLLLFECLGTLTIDRISSRS